VSNLDELSVRILERLYNHGKIGGSHAHTESVIRGLPSHLKGNAIRAVKKLIKDGYIIQHPTSYGMQIALNPQRIKEIRELIGQP
jgi:hypothetical protein